MADLGTKTPLSVHAWCLSRKTPVSRGRSAPPAEGAGAGVREWRQSHTSRRWGATAQPDGSRPGNASPTYPVCRQSAQVSGMPSCSQSQTARSVGLCRGPAHPCMPPGRQDSPSACSARQASPMIWQPKRPPAEARFSSPWTNSTASRHNQGSPECVVIADAADRGCMRRYML